METKSPIFSLYFAFALYPLRRRTFFEKACSFNNTSKSDATEIVIFMYIEENESYFMCTGE